MLLSSYNLKGKTVKNRFVFPPVVFSGHSHDGKVTKEHIEHYKNIAKGGVGLVISEATCIEPSAKLSLTQLGCWSDEFIEGLGDIAKVVHDEGLPVICQIHHAGNQSRSGQPVAPSEIKKEDGSLKAKELSVDEIKKIQQQFADTAKRIEKAGFDGVEIHGAHGYLLSYFLSSRTNKRQDQYGGRLENRARLVLDIIKQIRKECSPGFIIGIRFGGATPTLEDGIAVAKMLEAAGCDYLHVSWGSTPKEIVEVPQEFSEFNSYIYTAIEIKKHVNIPIIAVNEVSTYERSKKLVDGGLVDFVALARPILADYDFVNKSINNQKINECLKCSPRCQWLKEALIHCPARLKK